MKRRRWSCHPPGDAKAEGCPSSKRQATVASSLIKRIAESLGFVLLRCFDKLSCHLHFQQGCAILRALGQNVLHAHPVFTGQPPYVDHIATCGRSSPGTKRSANFISLLHRGYERSAPGHSSFLRGARSKQAGRPQGTRACADGFSYVLLLCHAAMHLRR
jgi:hypothetical protein